MPSIAITQPYEAVYIVNPDLGDEQIQTISAKYRQIVESGGGTVEKIDVWERRKLAYEIKGRTEGIYVVMQFRSKPAIEAELRRIFQISEDQIRSLIVRRDDEDGTTTAATPAAQPAQAAPVPAPVVEAAPVAEVAPVAEAAPETPEPAETPELALAA